MSDLRRNENFEDSASEKPKPCHNCCEFFGNQSTEWLCSKCYK